MMSSVNVENAPLFQVHKHHSASCGSPPHIDDLRPSDYLGYFENQYGEQAVFVYDHHSGRAILYLGDAGWETAHRVLNGAVPDLVLSETEQLWVRACWQAAAANGKQV